VRPRPPPSTVRRPVPRDRHPVRRPRPLRGWAVDHLTVRNLPPGPPLESLLNVAGRQLRIRRATRGLPARTEEEARDPGVSSSGFQIDLVVHGRRFPRTQRQGAALALCRARAPRLAAAGARRRRIGELEGKTIADTEPGSASRPRCESRRIAPFPSCRRSSLDRGGRAIIPARIRAASRPSSSRRCIVRHANYAGRNSVRRRARGNRAAYIFDEHGLYGRRGRDRASRLGTRDRLPSKLPDPERRRAPAARAAGLAPCKRRARLSAASVGSAT